MVNTLTVIGGLSWAVIITHNLHLCFSAKPQRLKLLCPKHYNSLVLILVTGIFEKKDSLYHYLEIPFPASFSNFYFWQIENLFSKVLVMESINLQICSRIFENKISWENFWEFWTLIVNALWHVSDSKGLLDSLGLYWIALL